jgi:molecular chaperone IbpA
MKEYLMFRLIGNQPLSSSFLGFDRLFREIDELLELSSNQSVSGGFPPYNLYKEEDGYSIELAVAGFKADDLKVERDRTAGTLTVSGGDSKSSGTEIVDTRKPIRQGIAKRTFVRTFTLAEDVEVTGVDLKDGMLSIRLKQEKKPENKPEVLAVTQS